MAEPLTMLYWCKNEVKLPSIHKSSKFAFLSFCLFLWNVCNQDSYWYMCIFQAEGAPKTYTESEFLEAQSGSPTVLKFLPDIPDNAVPGSGRIVINIVGECEILYLNLNALLIFSLC